LNLKEKPMTHEGALVLKVSVRQEGPVFYANSADLIGLHVCGDTLDIVCERVVKSVKAIFKHARGVDVEVLPTAQDFASFPSAKPTCEQFVVHRAAA